MPGSFLQVTVRMKETLNRNTEEVTMRRYWMVAWRKDNNMPGYGLSRCS